MSRFFLAPVALFAFAYGVAVGHYQVFPYPHIQKAVSFGRQPEIFTDTTLVMDTDSLDWRYRDSSRCHFNARGAEAITGALASVIQ